MPPATSLEVGLGSVEWRRRGGSDWGWVVAQLSVLTICQNIVAKIGSAGGGDTVVTSTIVEESETEDGSFLGGWQQP